MSRPKTQIKSVSSILPEEVPTREMLVAIPLEQLLAVKAIPGQVQLYARFSNRYSKTTKHAQAEETLWDMLQKYRKATVRVKNYWLTFTYGHKKQVRLLFITEALPGRPWVQ